MYVSKITKIFICRNSKKTRQVSANSTNISECRRSPCSRSFLYVFVIIGYLLLTWIVYLGARYLLDSESHEKSEPCQCLMKIKYEEP